jgi:hypothetical protein
VINLGIDYAISKRTSVTSEVAMSNYDANTFSKINNGDDAGCGKIQIDKYASHQHKTKGPEFIDNPGL